MTNPIKLVWNQIDATKWQAGGLARLFDIEQDAPDEFVLTQKIGDVEPVQIGVFSKLPRAQARAQGVLDGVIPKATAQAAPPMGKPIDYDLK